MATKSYLSTIHPAWSLDRQRALIGADGGTEYVDEFGIAGRRRRDPATLKQRADLLRPTSRKADDVIIVASPSCFAFSPDDFSAALAAAAARNATVRFLDTGTEIPPRPETELIDKVLRQFGIALRRRGLHRPREEIAEERRKDTLRRIEIIRPLWPLRTHTTPELLMMAGRGKRPMAPATAKDHLGSRPAVQKDYDRDAREAGRRAARERRKERLK